MDLLDFFDLTKDFQRPSAPQGCISSKLLAGEPQDSKPIKREIIGVEYVEEIVAEEKRKLSKISIGGPSTSKMCRTLDDLDNDDEDDDDDYEMDDESKKVRSDEEYYNKYRFDLERNKNMPIYTQREEIINAIEHNPVVILKGDTGCGKTTQVPQYILDEAFKRREYCNIVVTQPRRIAAISIANRVCEERKWHPGTVCSYQVGLHRQTSNQLDTRILYCTTAVLLNTLIRQRTLTHYTHIILDEVHERDQDMDFLLIVVRRLLALNSHHVKIILMSATIDTREFCQYFTTSTMVPPVISTSHGRKYPLAKFYRDQLKNIHFSEQPQQTEPGISPEGYTDAIKILLIIDNMERKPEYNSQQSYEESKRTGAVLIFLPGIHEIETMAEHITSVTNKNPSLKLAVVRCHSLLSPEIQGNVFDPPPPGHRKVILTTNISESSITVPDVSYVIDYCLTKVLHIDSATNFTTLQLEWASKVNCRQRAGRVGRLRSGRVYRMVSKKFYKNEMSEFGVPDMLRSSLNVSVLRAKQLEMGPPVDILALAMSPPNLSDIQNTVLLLKEVGALYRTVDGVYEDLDGDLTFWGVIMSNLPLDVRLSRLIILGYMFNCLDEAIIIAAGLTVRGLYETGNRGKMLDTFWIHYLFSDGSGSDLVAIYRLYRTYINLCQDRMASDSAKKWARRYNINMRSLNEMHLLVQDLRMRCDKINLHPISSASYPPLDDHEKTLFLKIVIAGAFYPNYFVRSHMGNDDYDRDVSKVICGRDPCRTVFFTNYEPRFMGELYAQRIKELFAETKIPMDLIEVNFQHGSEKVLVTFKPPEEQTESFVQMPGRIMIEVFKALRMRAVSMSHTIRVMDQQLAMNYVEKNRIGLVKEGKWLPPAKQWNVELLSLPSVFEDRVRGLITYIDNCGKFYFQPESLAFRISSLSEIFNAPQHLKYRVNSRSVITKGLLLLARRGNLFQRGVVVGMKKGGRGEPLVEVRFVDYGDKMSLGMDQLRLMPDELKGEFENLPPRMFECRLALVQPSSISCLRNSWARDANDRLCAEAKRGPVTLEIYSVVDNVAAVLVHTRDGLLNDKLVARQLARRANEDYMSSVDHDMRLRKQQGKRHLSIDEQRQINEEYLRFIHPPVYEDLQPPPLERCNRNVRLKGPFSPLETKMASMLRIAMYKSTVIDRDSVNGVLLDGEPQDYHDHLIVAASVSEKNIGEELIARGTTQMPNIHGFGALMTMLFCPTMQIKCNETRTKYVCVLAGLGFDPNTMKPLFEEHDMVVNLDVGILKDDINIINQMRYSMDSMFHNIDVHEMPYVHGEEDRALIFNKLRTLAIRLISKDRCFMERHVSYRQHMWEEIEDLDPAGQPFETRAIFPLHSAHDLESEDMNTLLALQKNCQSLYNLRNFDGVMQAQKCMLCNMHLESITQLRLHLLTQLHRDREKQVDFQLK